MSPSPQPSAPQPRQLAVEYVPLGALTLDPGNARVHPPKQIKQIARSIEAFSFNVPVLVDREGKLLAGHGRVLALRLLGRSDVPVIRLEHLTPEQARAFAIADNRLIETSTWDEQLLAQHFKSLSEIDLTFDLEATGFTVAEIDLKIQSPEAAPGEDDPADAPAPSGPLVTRPGDLWETLGHRVLCADALQPDGYVALVGDERASMTFTDPPYNVAIQGNAAGFGKITYEEFAMASGEMSEAEFTQFLVTVFTRIAEASAPGALAYSCIDWRHLFEVIGAGRQAFKELKNVCVWAKASAGQGSFYRSQHEMVAVFEVAGGKPRNNIQLGRFGRHRSNLWTYPSPAAFGRSGDEGRLTEDHPTPKPVAMVADAMLDCTARGDIVLDPFLGGGATLIAAERVGRRCRAIEIEPRFVDASLRRLRRQTGEDARRLGDGRLFSDLEAAAADNERAAA